MGEFDDEDLYREGEEVGGDTIALSATGVSLGEDFRLFSVHLEFYEWVFHEGSEHVDEFVGEFEEFHRLE